MQINKFIYFTIQYVCDTDESVYSKRIGGLAICCIELEIKRKNRQDAAFFIYIIHSWCWFISTRVSFYRLYTAGMFNPLDHVIWVRHVFFSVLTKLERLGHRWSHRCRNNFCLKSPVWFEVLRFREANENCCYLFTIIFSLSVENVCEWWLLISIDKYNNVELSIFHSKCTDTLRHISYFFQTIRVWNDVSLWWYLHLLAYFSTNENCQIKN